MVDLINRKERFATEGIRFQRHNPDGTIPTAQRFLGFANKADLSKVLTANEAPMTIRIDDGAVMTETIKFTAADQTAVTVQEAITALTGKFTGVTFSVDEKTNRLKGSAAAGKIIQVVSPLAAALDFGQGIKFGGSGLEMISFFDDETISIGLPKDIKDKEEIDQEGVKGTITRMVIGAMLQGLSPVVTLKEKDYFLVEMIQGGSLDRKTWAYNPPLSGESEHPTFWAEIFSAVYSKGSNKLTDVSGYERLLLRSMIGMEGDVPIEAKAWATYAYNLTATEYTDAENAQWPAWEEQPISLEAFDALKVKQIKIAA